MHREIQRSPWRDTALAILVAGTCTLSHAQAPSGVAGSGESLQLKMTMPQTAFPSSANAARSADTAPIRVVLSPQLETTLVAQIVGRITTLNASIGARVVKGHTIVAFDCGEANARLQIAQAEHAGAKETLDVKNRLLQLEAAGESEVTLAAAAANRASASIALARAQLRQCNVPAPFSGQIVRVHVKPHQGVNIGMPLVEMISDGPLKVRLNAPSRLLSTLRVGTPFQVAIDETGKSYAAKVTAINARVDAVAQTVELEGNIEGKHPELLAGMTGAARFRIAP